MSLRASGVKKHHKAADGRNKPGGPEKGPLPPGRLGTADFQSSSQMLHAPAGPSFISAI
jgi:hypothetical protein